MKCPLCDGPVVKGRCTVCGMPYRNDEVLYHLNESRSDHYEHATPKAKKIMKKQQSSQSTDTAPGRNATRESIQEHQRKVRQDAVKRMTGGKTSQTGKTGTTRTWQTTNTGKSGKKTKKKGSRLLVLLILLSVLAGMIPGIVDAVRQIWDKYTYSQAWEQTDEDQAVQDVYGTEYGDSDYEEYFRTWKDDDTEYFAVDAGYGTIEVADGKDVAPGSYAMFAIGDTDLKVCITSGDTEKIYDVKGTGDIEYVDLKEGDEINFQDYSELTDTLYLTKDVRI